MHVQDLAAAIDIGQRVRDGISPLTAGSVVSNSTTSTTCITAMLATLRDLFCHQAFTDAALLNAIRRHETAARDQKLRTLLHHILLAHRYWIQLSQGLPFSEEEETTVPDSLDVIVARYQATQVQEKVWLLAANAGSVAVTVTGCVPALA